MPPVWPQSAAYPSAVRSRTLLVAASTNAMPSPLLLNPVKSCSDDRMFNVQVTRPGLFVSTLFQGAANPDVACVSYAFASVPLIEGIESWLLTMLES